MSTLSRLVAPARPHARLLAITTLLSFGALGAGIGLMALSAYLISKAALVTGFIAVAFIVTGVRSLAISRAVLRYCERYTTHLVTFQILTTLRVWLFTAIEPLAPARLEDRRTPDLLARITSDIDSLDQFYVRGLVAPLAAVLAMLLGIVILAAFDWLIGLATLLLLLMSGVALPLLHLCLARRPAAEEASMRGELTVAMADFIHGLTDTVSFGNEWRSRDEALRLNVSLAAAQRRAGYLRVVFSSASGMLMVAATLLALVIAGRRVEEGTLAGVYLALLPLTVVGSFEAAHLLAAAIERVNVGVVAERRLSGLVEEARPITQATVISPMRDHSIEFRDVHFGYPEGESLLSGMSFNVPSGGVLYVMGPSGSGKSTLINLLLRFWEADRGEIRIGGVDIRQLPVDELRALFAVVPQNPYLFNTTLRDNLLLARADATDAELESVCERAQLQAVVDGFPNGYQTLVGENGLKLSGGERQRLAIARGLLKDAPILVLDEATSNLDASTEDRVWMTLEDEMRHRTAIVITHDRPRVPPDARVLLTSGC